MYPPATLPPGSMGSPGVGMHPPITPPPGSMCPPATGNQGMPGSGINLSPQEREYYHQLYAYADPERKGFVDRKAGAALLNSTRLPHDTLHTIWNIADSRQEGLLSMDRFFVALRLCAHAQSNRPVAPELANLEPPMLPDVQDVPRRRGDSECSPVGSRAPSIVGNTSDISDLQPVISGGEALVRRAADSARQGAKSPRSFYRERWAPSARERRKYATLFQRTDKNGDGFVEAPDVKELLERSGLDLGSLMAAWEHADREQRGKLNWREFVVIVHLVSCVHRGARMPGLQEGLPPELIAGIQNLEPPDVLIREREARSRSQSPVNSRGNSPAFLHATPLQTPARPAPMLDQGLGQGWGAEAASPDAGWGAGGGGGGTTAGCSGGFEEGFGKKDQQGLAMDFGSGMDLGARNGGGWGGATEGFQTDGFGAGGEAFPATDPLPPLSTKEKKGKKSKKEGKSREASQEPARQFSNNDNFAMGWDRHADPHGGELKGQNSATVRTLQGSSSRERLHEGDGAHFAARNWEQDQRESQLGHRFATDPPLGETRQRSKSRDRDHRDHGTSHRGGGLGQEDYSWSDRRETDAARRSENVHEQAVRDKEAKEQERYQLSGAISQFESMITADREVSRQLRREVDSMDEELRRVREAHDQMERQMKQEQLEAQRLVEQRRQLERQLQDTKNRLGNLREDRRAANLESISLRRDREHFGEELAFLRRMAEDEDKTLEVVRRANQFLEKSCQDLEDHTTKLEQQRKELLQQVAAEKQLKQSEERQNAEMRNQRDRTRREQAQFVAERREMHMREMRVQEMQNNGRPDPRRGVGLEAPRPDGSNHSWAHSVSGAGDTMSNGPGPTGVRLLGQPAMVGREGV